MQLGKPQASEIKGVSDEHITKLSPVCSREGLGNLSGIF